MKVFLVLVLAASFAFAACPSYPYTDYSWASAYASPARPADTFLGYCANLNLTNPSLCTLAQNLSIDGKKQLILDDLVKNNGIPPFAEASAWNSRIPFTKYPPDGVISRNSSYIKDAWVKIISLSPSLIDSRDNRIYLNDSGQLSIIHGFSLVVPQESFSGDCRTDYEVCGYDYSITAFDNGQRLTGNASAVVFSVPNRVHGVTNNFSVTLAVNSEYLIHHYNMQWKVVGWYWRRVCTLYRTDSRQDSLTVYDNATAYYYQVNASAKIFVDGFQNELADVWIRVTSKNDSTDFDFQLENAKLGLQRKQYQLKYGLLPYNVLTPVAVPKPESIRLQALSVLSFESKNASAEYSDKFHILASAKALNCTLRTYSPFLETVNSDACFFNQTQKPVLNLTVANVSNVTFEVLARFYDNSSNTPFSGKAIQFVYGNQSAVLATDFLGTTRTNFSFVQGVGLVSALFTTDFEVKSTKANAVVPAPMPDLLGILWYWIALAVGAWLTYLFLKRQYP